jgi:hypothetical protein
VLILNKPNSICFINSPQSELLIRENKDPPVFLFDCYLNSVS